MTRWFSLKRRLIIWLLAGITVGWLVAVGVAFVEVRHEVLELLEKRHFREKFAHKADHELVEHLLATMLTPLLVGLPIFGLWIWFASQRGLAPLSELAREVEHRSPEHLAPLFPAKAPQETKPLIAALNDLLGRLAEALEAERRFTADAAHELRTPIAALLAQAQVALRATDEDGRRHALEQIVAGCARAARLIDQLLTLARLDPERPMAGEEVRLDRLAAEVCAEHVGTALAKSIELELDAPAPASVTGHAEWLRILLRNLVDNALRYTPPGGKVTVSVATVARHLVLAVADNGPGIPPDERANVLRRFYRLAGQSAEGCGLGLSIVARIAELCHARLELADNQPGLIVRLHFPQA